MKRYIYKNIALVFLVAAAGCKQDVYVPAQPPTPAVITPSKGTADFSKYVAIGNSLTAGYQAGALFNEGQANSFPLIMAKQFESVGGSTTFNQPDINSVNGYSGTNGAHVLGRYILFAADGNQADALPTPAGKGLPAPYDTADAPFAYAGWAYSKGAANLNNFGVPGILLGQSLTPLTGGPASPQNPAFNPYYARFASSPGNSTIISDALSAKPTFFSFDLGNNDVLGYATSGGDAHIVPLTDPAAFTQQYTAAIATLIGSSTAPSGVVSTIPNVAILPYFHAVPWNAIPLSADDAAATQAGLAVGYNQFLAAMVANKIITADELAKRTLAYVAGQNPILIADTDLTDLTPYMKAEAPPLLPYARARQTTANDLVTLSAGSVLGTGPSATAVYGVSIPMADKYILVPSEIDSVETHLAAFNATIVSVAGSHPGKVAVADVNAAFTSLATNGAYVSDGVTITDSFAPPLGGFSEDGVHPNSRGYAYLANIFIDAIEKTFGATIPHASLADHKGVGLPLVP